MPTSQGFLTKCGFKRETNASYNNTAVTLIASDLIPYKSENIQIQLKTKDDESLIGNAGKTGQDITGKLYSGPVTVTGQYQGLDTLLACGLGHSQYFLGTHQIETTAYRHIYVPDSDLRTDFWKVGEVEYPKASGGFVVGTKKIRRGTLAFNKVVSAWEYLSTMINKITIKGNSQNIEFIFDVSSASLNLSPSGNTVSNFNSLSFTTYPTILFSELVATIGDYSISSVVGSALRITDFEITLDNTQQVDLQTNASGLAIEEPTRNGFRSVTGTLTFPRYSDDSGWYGNDFITNMINGTNKALKLVFTSSTLAGATEYYGMRIYLPSLKFQSGVPNISNPGIIPHTLNFQAFIPAGYQRGFLERFYSDAELSTSANDNTVTIVDLTTNDAVAGDSLVIDDGADAGVYQVETVSAGSCTVDSKMTATAGSLTGRIIYTHRKSEIMIETINKLTANPLV